jgi:YVTN family beta-propeller protein
MKINKLLHLSTVIFSAALLSTYCATDKSQPLAESDTEQQETPAPPEPIEDCVVSGFADDATAMTGPFDAERWITADGKIISPVGDLFVADGVLTLGLAAATVDGEQALVISNGNRDGSHPSLELFRLDSANDLIAHVNYSQTEAGSTYYGLQFNAVGDLLFVSAGGSDRVDAYRFETGNLNFLSSIDLSGYICGLTLSADEQTLYAVGNNNNRFYAIDVADPAVMQLTWSTSVGFFPYAIALSPTKDEAYVSNWQGNTVSVVDLANHETVAFIEVDKNPEELVVTANGSHLFVANSDSDTVSVIDTNTRAVTQKLDVSYNDEGLVGSWPTALALDEQSGRLYVALTGRNQIDVFSLGTFTLLGSIPTAWRPSKIVISDDFTKLYISSSKGVGAGANDGGPHVTKSTSGAIQVIEKPTQTELDRYTLMTEENASRTSAIFSTECPNVVPVPSTPSDPSPIKHVVWIMKENKTYDEIMGDMAGPQGDRWHDPELAVFGEQYTPNTHKLARQFTNFVNYYVPIECSLQGHTMFTAGTCNDFCEKTNTNQFILPSIEPGSIPASGTIFDLCYKHGVSFRNYGQIVGFHVNSLGLYADFINYRYPFWNNGVLDVDKAAEVIREIKAGIFPSFVYISLPNDHTLGGSCGHPTPRYMVADNDAALGMIVDAISNSPYWEKTLIFIFQDDAQSSSGDHIDARRSLLLAIGPWVKKGYMTEVHYSAQSIFRTTEMILGLPPLGSFDANATPMYDIFTDQPDFSPYEYIANPLEPEFNCDDSAPTRLFVESLEEYEDDADENENKMDFSVLDRAPGLGDVIWKIMKGDTPRPPQSKRLDR